MVLSHLPKLSPPLLHSCYPPETNSHFAPPDWGCWAAPPPFGHNQQNEATCASQEPRPRQLNHHLLPFRTILVTAFILHTHGCFRKYWYPQIIHFNRVFHCKPSILGYPYFWKHPHRIGTKHLNE